MFNSERNFYTESSNYPYLDSTLKEKLQTSSEFVVKPFQRSKIKNLLTKKTKTLKFKTKN